MSNTDNRTTGKKISDWLADRGTGLNQFLSDASTSEYVKDLFKTIGDVIYMGFIALFDPEQWELESAVRGWGSREWESNHPNAQYSHDDATAPSGPAQSQAPARQPTPASALNLTDNFMRVAGGEPGWGVRAPEANPPSFNDTFNAQDDRLPTPMLPSGMGGPQ